MSNHEAGPFAWKNKMQNREVRIHFQMTLTDSLLEMAGGNPGATTALAKILEHGSGIDPDAATPFMHVLHLDSMGIYEERIYMLWNDVCKRDIATMIAVIRAYQLGQLGGATLEVINHAIDNRGDGLDLDAVVFAVKEKLPRFDPTGRAVPERKEAAKRS